MPSRVVLGVAHTIYDPMSATPRLTDAIFPKWKGDVSRSPWITCTVYDAESDQLFMTDNFNYKVKVVNMKDPETIVHELEFNHKPRRLALMPGRRMALTLDDCRNIVILDVRDAGKAKVVKFITTEKSYRGVVAVDQKTLCLTHFIEFAADDGLAEIDVVDMNGSVVRTVASQGTIPSLKSPDYLVLSPDGTLFVSDWGSRSIHCLELATGNVLRTFWHHDLGCPCQICLDDSGNLVVASMEGCGVMVVSKEGKWRRLLEDGGEGFKAAISFSLLPSAIAVSWEPVSGGVGWGGGRSSAPQTHIKLYDMV